VVTPHLTPPALPALVEGTVTHARRTPLRTAFTHRHYQWLVDVDDLPRFRGATRMVSTFDARDHLDRGRLGGGLRGDVERFLRVRGIELAADDRVIMLANARVLGHTFDPLSVFWCLRPTGGLVAVVLEVHNTYGERHAYLLELRPDGRAEVEKAFYVSPFNDVTGSYDVRLVLEERTVAVTVALDRDGERVLTATTRGRLLPATRRNVWRLVRRHPFMTQRVTALIRAHGIALWLRSLPVSPRPQHPKEAVR
jgi:hypothetical protein